MFAVSLKLTLALKNPSDTVSVMVLLPANPGTGVTVTVRLVLFPARTTLASGTIAVLLDAFVTISELAAVSMSATVNGNAAVAVPAVVARSPMDVMVGASFTGLTVTWNVSLAVSPPLSVTVTVIAATPD